MMWENSCLQKMIHEANMLWFIMEVNYFIKFLYTGI